MSRRHRREPGQQQPAGQAASGLRRVTEGPSFGAPSDSGWTRKRIHGLRSRRKHRSFNGHGGFLKVWLLRAACRDGRQSRGLRTSLEDSRRSLWGFPLDISRGLGGPWHCYATPAVIRHSQVSAPAKVQPLRSEPAKARHAGRSRRQAVSPSQGPGSKARGHAAPDLLNFQLAIPRSGDSCCHVA